MKLSKVTWIVSLLFCFECQDGPAGRLVEEECADQAKLEAFVNA
jgi:hypothetical protein